MAFDTQLFANNAVSILGAPLTPAATSLTVLAGMGSLFPQPTGDGSDFFLVTLENQTASAREIIRVNARSGDTFTQILRAQEGTAALAWGATPGDDTLVDHRVTAETMRRAMLLPEGSSGISGINIEDNGTAVPPAATTLNFTGNVTVTDNGTTKDININPTAGDIYGGTSTPLVIDPGWTLPGDTASYADNNRGFKFFVTLTMPANHMSQTFEVLGNISGDIDAGTETVSFNRSARVGFNFSGSVNMVLDKPNKLVRLTWTNNEANSVIIQCVRIQQAP